MVNGDPDRNKGEALSDKFRNTWGVCNKYGFLLVNVYSLAEIEFN